MSRIVRAIVLAVPVVLLTTSAASAQANYPPSAAPTASVANLAGANDQAGAAGTAFTGAPGIPTGTILTAVLLVVGLSAVYVGWRRAERLSGPR
jgi:uncharacterized MAPEG superfamily protein